MSRRADTPGADDAVLVVRNLRTRFRTAEGGFAAVDGVSFRVDRGETLAIVGESGSGKSVTMLSILGLLSPTQAEVTADEIRFKQQVLGDLPDSALRRLIGREVGMVFQDPTTSLNPVMTIGRQIGESLERHAKLTGAANRARVAELLGLVGVPAAAARLDDYPHQFSGGMCQRVMIAMALACGPDLLVADEPTTALDVTIQAQILRLVRRLREQSDMAMLWITHDLGVVARLADRVAVMYAGRIVEEAAVRDFYAGPLHPYSRGLLASIPGTQSRRRGRLSSIGGQPPGAGMRGEGCAFADRCAFAVARCSSETPTLEQPTAASRDRVACWRWRELKEADHAA